MQLRVHTRNVNTSEVCKILASALISHVWKGSSLEPVHTMVMAASSALPLVPVPLIDEVELLFQDDITKQAVPAMEIICRNGRVFLEKTAGPSHSGSSPRVTLLLKGLSAGVSTFGGAC